MSSSWKGWALDAMALPGIDADPWVRPALEYVMRTGHEPYHTLKGAVERLRAAVRREESSGVFLRP